MIHKAFIYCLLASIPTLGVAQTAYQIWQVGGYPLPAMSLLGDQGGPVLDANPALQTAGNVGAGITWQTQTGDSRRTLVEPMPRAEVALPQAVGFQGNWHEMTWRAGFHQLYNSHEEARDSLLVWRPFDSRLEGMGVQAAMPVSLPYLTEFPHMVLGVGYNRYRLAMHQVNSWYRVVAGDTLRYQYDLDRKLLADGFTLGLVMAHHDARIGISWREETVWNHWAPEPLNPDSTGSIQVWGVLPQSLTMQLDLPLRPSWRLSGQMIWTEWSAAQVYLKDQVDMGLVVHGVLPRWKTKVHAGFTTSGTASSMVEAWGEPRSTWYILAGVETSLPHGVTASVSLADSHLGSGEYRKQTIAQAGVSINIPTR